MCLGWSNVKLPQHAWNATGAGDVLNLDPGQMDCSLILWTDLCLLVWTGLLALCGSQYVQHLLAILHQCNWPAQVAAIVFNWLVWPPRRTHGTQPGTSMSEARASLGQATSPGLGLHTTKMIATGQTDAAVVKLLPLAAAAGMQSPPPVQQQQELLTLDCAAAQQAARAAQATAVYLSGTRDNSSAVSMATVCSGTPAPTPMPGPLSPAPLNHPAPSASVPAPRGTPPPSLAASVPVPSLPPSAPMNEVAPSTNVHVPTGSQQPPLGPVQLQLLVPVSMPTPPGGMVRSLRHGLHTGVACNLSFYMRRWYDNVATPQGLLFWLSKQASAGHTLSVVAAVSTHEAQPVLLAAQPFLLTEVNQPSVHIPCTEVNQPQAMAQPAIAARPNADTMTASQQFGSHTGLTAPAVQQQQELLTLDCAGAQQAARAAQATAVYLSGTRDNSSAVSMATVCSGTPAPTPMPGPLPPSPLNVSPSSASVPAPRGAPPPSLAASVPVPAPAPMNEAAPSMKVPAPAASEQASLCPVQQQLLVPLDMPTPPVGMVQLLWHEIRTGVSCDLSFYVRWYANAVAFGGYSSSVQTSMLDSVAGVTTPQELLLVLSQQASAEHTGSVVVSAFPHEAQPRTAGFKATSTASGSLQLSSSAIESQLKLHAAKSTVQVPPTKVPAPEGASSTVAVAVTTPAISAPESTPPTKAGLAMTLATLLSLPAPVPMTSTSVPLPASTRLQVPGLPTDDEDDETQDNHAINGHAAGPFFEYVTKLFSQLSLDEMPMCPKLSCSEEHLHAPTASEQEQAKGQLQQALQASDKLKSEEMPRMVATNKELSQLQAQVDALTEKSAALRTEMEHLKKEAQHVRAPDTHVKDQALVDCKDLQGSQAQLPGLQTDQRNACEQRVTKQPRKAVDMPRQAANSPTRPAPAASQAAAACMQLVSTVASASAGENMDVMIVTDAAAAPSQAGQFPTQPTAQRSVTGSSYPASAALSSSITDAWLHGDDCKSLESLPDAAQPSNRDKLRPSSDQSLPPTAGQPSLFSDAALVLDLRVSFPTSESKRRGATRPGKQQVTRRHKLKHVVASNAASAVQPFVPAISMTSGANAAQHGSGAGELLSSNAKSPVAQGSGPVREAPTAGAVVEAVLDIQVQGSTQQQPPASTSMNPNSHKVKIRVPPSVVEQHINRQRVTMAMPPAIVAPSATVIIAPPPPPILAPVPPAVLRASKPSPSVAQMRDMPKQTGCDVHQESLSQLDIMLSQPCPELEPDSPGSDVTSAPHSDSPLLRAASKRAMDDDDNHPQGDDALPQAPAVDSKRVTVKSGMQPVTCQHQRDQSAASNAASAVQQVVPANSTTREAVADAFDQQWLGGCDQTEGDKPLKHMKLPKIKIIFTRSSANQQSASDNGTSSPMAGGNSNMPMLSVLHETGGGVATPSNNQMGGGGGVTCHNNEPRAQGNSPNSHTQGGGLRARRQNAAKLNVSVSDHGSDAQWAGGQCQPIIPPPPPSPGGIKPDALAAEDAQDMVEQSRPSSHISHERNGRYPITAPAESTVDAAINNTFVPSTPACFKAGSREEPTCIECSIRQSASGRNVSDSKRRGATRHGKQQVTRRHQLKHAVASSTASAVQPFVPDISMTSGASAAQHGSGADELLSSNAKSPVAQGSCQVREAATAGAVVEAVLDIQVQGSTQQQPPAGTSMNPNSHKVKIRVPPSVVEQHINRQSATMAMPPAIVAPSATVIIAPPPPPILAPVPPAVLRASVPSPSAAHMRDMPTETGCDLHQQSLSQLDIMLGQPCHELELDWSSESEEEEEEEEELDPVERLLAEVDEFGPDEPSPGWAPKRSQRRSYSPGSDVTSAPQCDSTLLRAASKRVMNDDDDDVTLSQGVAPLPPAPAVERRRVTVRRVSTSATSQ